MFRDCTGAELLPGHLCEIVGCGLQLNGQRVTVHKYRGPGPHVDVIFPIGKIVTFWCGNLRLDAGVKITLGV